ncbi:NADPH-dependent F420 reductase [Devosia lacusdianchii]|uniref:NADPH-dependent F420 reductase n=1 Tax=Devosia lacusdianchii TaxID=2917991 RepID=UPI001F0677EC|nr:NAD(P)-binding domain-containing protein [Devosia sp. JXJ CY 41]
MKIGVLGTGEVGQALARKLASDGHDVLMGARSATNEKAQAFARDTGNKAGAFADAIRHGEWLFVCVDGAHTIETLRSAGPDALDGKIVIDISNLPVPDPSDKGSLGLTVQRTFPNARVVKTLNCVSAELMTDPARLPGNHTVFVSSDDAEAKAAVVDLLAGFGWKSIVDLGGIASARGPEHFVALWVEIYGALGITDFNFAFLRGQG